MTAPGRSRRAPLVSRCAPLALILALAACGFVDLNADKEPPAAAPARDHLKRADLFMAESRADHALMELRAAERAAPPQSPELAEIYERQGRLFLAWGDVDQAQKTFEQGLRIAKALKIDGDVRARLHHGLGLCLVRRSRFGQAARAFEEGSEARPSGAVARELETGASESRLEDGLARGSVLPPSDTPPARIRNITFHGNRTKEEVLRRVIPLREGELLEGTSLRDAQRALFTMQLFKKIAVSSSPAGGDDADVDIYLKDGYYLIPFPFFALGSGGSRGGMFLGGRNVFRRAESFYLLGTYSPIGGRGAAGVTVENLSTEAWYGRRRAVERAYSDGGFSSTPGLGQPLDEGRETRYGAIRSAYLKEEWNGGAQFIFALPGRIAAINATYDYMAVRYTDRQGRVPQDSGRQGAVKLGARFGAGERALGTGSELGVIFGFGLADLEERLKPMNEPTYGASMSVDYMQGADLTGSDFTFSAMTGRVGLSASWGMRQQLSLDVAGGRGWSMPDARQFTTNMPIEGQYAREFRGDTVAGAALRYSYPFRVTRQGAWQAIAFAEGAIAQSAGTRHKTGLGAGAWYRWWKAPIPVGVIYTYSLDDRDQQLSFSVGGEF